MATFIVLKDPSEWPISIPGVQVISAKDYLLDPQYANLERARIFNLCRSYRYQSNGYYVSLLAEARKHIPLPSISTLQDMRSATISRIVTEDLDELIQEKLKDIQSKEFVLSIYFGKNIAEKYDRIALKLYNMFEAPLLRAYFIFKKEWLLKKITPISANDIPDSHREFVIQRAEQYFRRKYTPIKKRKNFKYDIAILHDPNEENPTSDSIALKKFMHAAEENDMDPELITRDDYSRVAEYDALFIRTTTHVSNYTYQFSRRAQAEGLVVIDDPESIIRCTNKIYVAEVLERAKVSTPKTIILHKDSLEKSMTQLFYPCIIKLPDSAFSLGVKKASDADEFRALAREFFEKSDLILVQEFIPTDFDWRIGIMDNKILYACKYHMAQNHWQIMKRTNSGRTVSGNTEGFALNRVPDVIKEESLRTAQLIGTGLYGVDIKLKADKTPCVIEINDNPSIDHNYEDLFLKDELYHKIMRSFFKRIETLCEHK